MGDHPTVTVLCGGVGAARFLAGLVQVVPPEQVTAVVNIADDIVLHGLHISPDIDTVIYTLADAIDTSRGWGLAGETWNAMDAISRFGDGDWFSLGDRDLATHMHRTQRLGEGVSITEVTRELRSAWDLPIEVLPVTDSPVSTRVTLVESGAEIGFQEYFVGHRHAVPISGVRFDGIEFAQLSAPAKAAIVDADIVIIAPSNPFVSIDPILRTGETAALLSARSNRTVAISPIVGGAAIKGPAADMLVQLGSEASVTAIASHYRTVAGMLVIDDADARLAGAVAREGCVPFVTDTIMADRSRAARLAARTLSVAGHAPETERG